MLTVLLTAVLFTSVNAVNALTPEREKCIRCICNAVSACFSLPKCAEKTVDLNYWLEAESPLTDNADGNRNNNADFSKCIQNDQCVLTAIDQYTRKIAAFTNDINCDGIVDCKDYLSVHKYGKRAKELNNIFTRAETRRYDICTGENLTDAGWKPGICIALRNNFIK